MGADPAASAQVKLDHVVPRLTEFMLDMARERDVQEESATIQQEAETNVHW